LISLPLTPQSLVLSIAFNLLEAEAKQAVIDKENYMSEHCPALDLPGSQQELQVTPLLLVSPVKII